MGNTAVVILNYNGVDYLKQFLPKVISNSADCQVVIIDNHSSDQSVTFLQSQFPEIKLITLDQNYGFSGGYNRGLRMLEADNYILLNSDVEVTEGWIEKLSSFMKAHPQVAACQPKILSFSSRNRFDYAGAAGGFLDILGYPFCRGRIFDHLETDHGQYDDNRLIFWAGGACFFVRAQVFHQLGGFDEDFFAHMEEIDLCWRINRAGHQVAYVGDGTVYHMGGGTLKETNPFKTFLNFRNGLQLLLKNTSVAGLLWKLPARILLDLVAGLRFLFQGSFSHFWAVLKAEGAFLISAPRTWSKRSLIGQPEAQNLYEGFIVWEYFIRGRKTYQQLSDGKNFR